MLIKNDMNALKSSTEKFNKAFDFIIQNEGGYNNDKYDPGGMTKYGICKKYHPDIDIQNLTLQKARDIYLKMWEKSCLSSINDINVAIKLFDTCINIGNYHTIYMLQKILVKYHFNIKTDGIIGNFTINAVNNFHDVNLLLNEFIQSLCQHYYNIISNKNHLKIFLNGWLKRAKRLH